MDLIQVLDVLGNIFEKLGYPIIFFGSLIEITPLGWAIPGGAILVIAGYLSNGGQNLSLLPIIIWGTMGTWIAFLLAYLLGNKSGMWLVNKLHQQKNARFAKHVLKRNGAMILTTSMMANLTRFWISYIAGVEKYNLLKFNLYAFVASLSWVSMLVMVGHFAGFEKENLRLVLKNVGIFAWIFLIVAIIILYKVIKHEYKHFIDDEPIEEKI